MSMFRTKAFNVIVWIAVIATAIIVNVNFALQHGVKTLLIRYCISIPAFFAVILLSAIVLYPITKRFAKQKKE